MATPVTVDLSAYYGNPDFREQNSGTVVDRRKILNLHKELESGRAQGVATRANALVSSTREQKSKGRRGGAVQRDGGAVAMGQRDGGAVSISVTPTRGGALAFNEAQLMSELSGLKKGGALGTVASAVLPALVQLAPQIISSIRSIRKGAKGGAEKYVPRPRLGGASAVFLDGVSPDKYDEIVKTMQAIQRQGKNLEYRGGALYAGSSRVGSFFRNAWDKIKTWYGNNADKIKPITDILVNAGVNAANNAINKGVNYVGNKTNSDTLRQVTSQLGNLAKDTLQGAVQDTYGDYSASSEPAGSGYDVGDVVNTVVPKTGKKQAKQRGRAKKIITALPQPENQTYQSVVKAAPRRRVY